MVTPLGRDAEETFTRASRGESGIRYIRSFDTTGLPCRIGGEVDDGWVASCEVLLGGKLDKFACRSARFALVAAREAARQSGIDSIADRERIGVSLGCHGANQSVEALASLHRFYDGEGRWDVKALAQTGGYPYLHFFRRKPDVAAAILSQVFHCKGASLSIVSACAAGAQAIGEGMRLIQEGACDAMIAGGCDAMLDFVGFMGFDMIQALATRYSSPEKASRPFDRKRSGFVMGEGAGIVVLEEFEHARRRGVPILGELLGYGDSADAYRITDTHPQGEGAVLAMQGALKDAALEPGAIDYINAHGTSTTQNDAVETLAIKKVFGDCAKKIPISSNKSMLGHTIGAAGAIECILTLMGMRRSVILPTINYEFADPKCDLDYVPNLARRQEHRVALSNSFGFGGQNACLCIGQFTA
jgi:3-oxoacyl-[acyl-carrier-protein] synthase II